MRFEPLALHLRIGEVGPAVAFGDRLLLAGQRGALVRHLEEEQEGELLDVVQVREPVVAQDVAVAPELLDDRDSMSLFMRRSACDRGDGASAEHSSPPLARHESAPVGRTLVHRSDLGRSACPRTPT